MEIDESIDRRCDEFEFEWNAGREPLLGNFLNGIGEHQRSTLLAQLIAVDIDIRRQLGKYISSDLYQQFGAEAVHLAGKRIAGFAANCDRPGHREITHCSACGVTVTPRHDDTCPSCGNLMVETKVLDVLASTHSGTDSDKGQPENCDLAVTFVASRRAADGSFVVADAPNDGQLFPGGTLLNDRYRLGSELGRGGMGAVFIGLDIRLDRQVAIKFIRIDRLAYNSERMRQEFEQEAKLGANLRHASIATVYDYGFHHDVPYVVFEYVSGKSLKEVIAKNAPMPMEDVQVVVGQIASGLDYAHEKGIIHRDLKPDNLRFDEHNNIRILDFGLAKRFAAHDDWSFAGTPAYASPEQASEQPSDGRTDQYSLGVIVYEMLSSRRPFHGGSAAEILKCHRTEPPAALRTINPAINLSTDEAIGKALSKHPWERHSSCSDFARAIGCSISSLHTEMPQIVFESAVRIRSTGLAYAWMYIPFCTSKVLLALTQKAMILVTPETLESWSPKSVRLIQRKGRTVLLSLQVGEIHDRTISAEFQDMDRAASFWEKLAILQNEAVGSDDDGAHQRTEMPLLLKVNAPIECQILGRVSTVDGSEKIGRLRLGFRAFLLGANAVIRYRFEANRASEERGILASGEAIRTSGKNAFSDATSLWHSEYFARHSGAMSLLCLFWAPVGISLPWLGALRVWFATVCFVSVSLVFTLLIRHRWRLVFPFCIISLIPAIFLLIHLTLITRLTSTALEVSPDIVSSLPKKHLIVTLLISLSTVRIVVRTWRHALLWQRTSQSRNFRLRPWQQVQRILPTAFALVIAAAFLSVPLQNAVKSLSRSGAKVQLAEFLISIGNLPSARKVVQKSLLEDNENADLWLMNAMLSFDAGDFSIAANSSSRSLGIRESLDARLIQAKCHWSVGDYERAIADCRKIQEQSPEHTEASFLLAMCLASNGRSMESILEFAKFRLDCEDEDVYVEEYSSLLLRLVDRMADRPVSYSDAIPLLDIYITLNPESDIGYAKQSVACFNSGLTDLAFAHADKALSLDSTNPFAHFVSAMVLTDRKEFSKVIEHVDAAIVGGYPDLLASYKLKGNACQALGLDADAAAAFSRVEAIQSNLPEQQE